MKHMSVSIICILYTLLLSISSIYSTTDSTSLTYSVFIDAGSAGTRVYIYTYNIDSPLDTLTEISSKKIQTALSSLYLNEEGLRSLIESLTAHAKHLIPRDSWGQTPISLKATAGLRRLPLASQEWLMEHTRSLLSSSGFRSHPNDTRVISGQEEALYDWMAVVIAFQTNGAGGFHLGAVDMGGASKQIAFTVDHSNPIIVDSSCAPDWVISHKEGTRVGLVARSVNGLGLMVAMDEVLSLHNISACTPEENTDQIVEGVVGVDGTMQPASTQTCLDGSANSVALHPCLATGEFATGTIHNYDYSLRGVGDMEKCLEMIRATLLPRIEEEIDVKCIHRYRPTVLVAMDSFPKMVDVLGLSHDPKGLSPSKLLDAGRRVCAEPWEVLLGRFPGYMPYKAQRACFAAAYMYFLLTDVYGAGHDDVGNVWPLDQHLDHELSWVLGAAALSTLPNEFVASFEKSFESEIRDANLNS
mmetsp:Transcript_10676/g.16173  ORF Transcript_10676/g.16173 Transcript_10676/m.16173 type:complete len:472 (-) Transcript_10676:11-1426(-)